MFIILIFLSFKKIKVVIITNLFKFYIKEIIDNLKNRYKFDKDYKRFF